MTAMPRPQNPSAPPAGDDVHYRRFDERHPVNRFMLAAGDWLRRYHRHRVDGLEHLASALAGEHPVVLVGNHCFDIVDPLMLTTAIHRHLGHVLRFIGHGNLFFTMPILRTLAPIWGIVPNRHMELAATVLREERALMLYPGSGSEAALRSYRREPYRLKWFDRLGFVELAARNQAALLFVAGIGIDELYYQSSLASPASLIRMVNGGDDAYYRGARVQVGLAGPHMLPAFIPLPVRVTHVISPPLRLDPALDPEDHDALERAQLDLWAECQAFLDRCVAARPSDLLDGACRRALGLLYRFGI